MKAKELDEIVRLHGLWLKGELLGVRASLEEADLEGASLEEADLEGADLRGASLEEADLREANLGEANLEGADLRGANLRGASLEGASLEGADLRGANLRGASLEGAALRGADLRRTNLRGASLRGASLREADLRGASLPESPVVENLHQKVEDAVNDGNNLDMSEWHSCETTHCRAGWAIALAGKPGLELEKKLGPAVAGTLIYANSTGFVPNFYADTKTALASIIADAEKERAQ